MKYEQQIDRLMEAYNGDPEAQWNTEWLFVKSTFQPPNNGCLSIKTIWNKKT